MSNSQFRQLLGYVLAGIAADGLDSATMRSILATIARHSVETVPPLSPKAHRSYERKLIQAAATFLRLYPKNDGKDVPALEYLNSVLAYVADLVAEMPEDTEPRRERRRAWMELEAALADEIGLRDPELTSYVDSGAALGEALRQVAA